MKKKLLDLKSIFVGVAVGALLFSGIVTASTLVSDVYFNQFPIYSNGTSYTSTMPLLNYQGRTYVPLDEFGKLSGADVKFANNTIYVNSNQNSYYDSNYNYFTYSSTTSSKLKLDVNDSESFYVNLGSHNSSIANITYNSSYVKLSRTYLTYSGNVTITGKKEGSATVKITYGNGDVEYIYVTVEDDDDYEDELEIEVGDYDTFYVDLDDYDADKATLTYDDDYIKLSKSVLYSSGKVTVTGKKKGDTTIKIKYDTGDIDYIYVEVTDDDDDDDRSEIEVSSSGSISFYVDLDYYDADKATLTYDSNYVSLSKTTFYSSGKVTITGKKKGDTTVKIKYDTGDIEYIDIDIY